MVNFCGTHFLRIPAIHSFTIVMSDFLLRIFLVKVVHILYSALKHNAYGTNNYENLGHTLVVRLYSPSIWLSQKINTLHYWFMFTQTLYINCYYIRWYIFISSHNYGHLLQWQMQETALVPLLKNTRATSNQLMSGWAGNILLLADPDSGRVVQRVAKYW